ncbi:hypothetical protein [Flavobacterium sp.]|jgi:hypothetical protein|uniref:hypothetical protein n=1 Tax=Flavobacterium sp. TaxID=239 RepID=UPI0037BF3457
MNFRKNVLLAAARAILVILIVFFMFSLLVLFPTAVKAETEHSSKDEHYLYQIHVGDSFVRGDIRNLGLYKNLRSCRDSKRTLEQHVKHLKTLLICAPTSQP